MRIENRKKERSSWIIFPFNGKGKDSTLTKLGRRKPHEWKQGSHLILLPRPLHQDGSPGPGLGEDGARGWRPCKEIGQTGENRGAGRPPSPGGGWASILPSCSAGEDCLGPHQHLPVWLTVGGELPWKYPWKCSRESYGGDLPGDPVFKTSASDAGGAGSIPGWGDKIPCTSRPKNRNIKQKPSCNRFHKDLKNGPHKNV